MGDNTYFKTRYSADKGRTVVWKAICEYLQKYIPQGSAVLELGTGYADFINNIIAQKKYALDVNPESKKYCDPNVVFLNANACEAIDIPPNSVDVIFASNFIEHMGYEDIDRVFSQIDKVLKEKGILILIQPNYYYCYRSYWDDYTHQKAYTHASLADLLVSKRYEIKLLKKKFMPFSFKSAIPKSYWLTKLYLQLPIKPMAKQMLVIARKNRK